ncbi:hypothetical protein ECDEC10C_1564 [Escherichia coli DEC10C]|nr:hypothetical protein ECDEC10C_1916 [Escherichia coli DEC10C]EHW78081.1 hypothetical protein ECDEC10C_1564 [Escherichia coli DEC10C]
MREARWISDWNDCEFAEILIISSRNVAIHLSPGVKNRLSGSHHS